MMTDGKSDNGWGPDMDVPEHEGTFEGFVTATKYSTIALVVLMALMAIFLL